MAPMPLPEIRATTDPAAAVLAPVRRRRALSAGAHAEFFHVVMTELRGALAALREAMEVLAERGPPVSGVRRLEAARVGELQTRKVEWLMRLLETVDGRGVGRRVEAVDVGTVARQALDGFGIPLTIDDPEPAEGFQADPERVRLGLELLLGALAAPSETGAVEARLVPLGLLALKAREIDFDDAGRRWRLSAAYRVLGSEDCALKVRTIAGGVRAEVRFGPAP